MSHRTVKKAAKRLGSVGLRAEFAARWNFGDPPVIDWWILEEGERWHDAVAGDGCSYYPCSQDTVYPNPGESREEFRRRISLIAEALTYSRE